MPDRAIVAAIRDGQEELVIKADLAAGLAVLNVDMLRLALGIVVASTTVCLLWTFRRVSR